MRKTIISLIVCLGIFFLFVLTPSMYQLPFPRGVFGISVSSEFFVDNSRTNDFIGIKGPRALPLFIWYPNDNQITYTYPYGNETLLKEQIALDFSLLGTIFWFKQITGNHPLSNYSYSSPNGEPLSLSKKKYPIIIFSPGYGAPVFLYSSLIEDLTSSGFIVVGMNHTPYNGVSILPNGTVIPCIEPSKLHTDIDFQLAIDHSVQDISFIIDQLKILNEDTTSHWYQRLDLDNIGAIGHSLGGAIVVNACRKEKRIKAGVNLDGWLGYRKDYTGFTQPFIFFINDHNFPTKSLYQENLSDIRITCNNSKKATALIMILPKSYHLSFCDFTLFSFPLNLLIPIERYNQYLNVERLRSYINQFFQTHLTKDEFEDVGTAPKLDVPPAQKTD